MKRFTFFIVAIIILLILGLIEVKLNTDTVNRETIVKELSYFPSGRFLRIVSMGFDGIISDWIWLRFVQYYGYHHLTDKDYSYVYHIMKILTVLDYRFIQAYTFGAIILITDAEEPEKGFDLLKQGMMKNPSDWKMAFMTGFINYIFMKDYNSALSYFKLSSHKPDAPEMPGRFAAFISKKKGYYQISLKLWYELLNTTNNKYEKETAIMYIKDIHIIILKNKVKEYMENEKRLPLDIKELENKHYISVLPVAPDGGEYLIDWDKKQITCDTGGCIPQSIDFDVMIIPER